MHLRLLAVGRLRPALREAADEYLRRLARVLRESVDGLYAKDRPSFDDEPILSRLSGDEFAVYLPGLTEAEGMEAAEEIRKAVEAFYFNESAGSSARRRSASARMRSRSRGKISIASVTDSDSITRTI